MQLEEYSRTIRSLSADVNARFQGGVAFRSEGEKIQVNETSYYKGKENSLF